MRGLSLLLLLVVSIQASKSNGPPKIPGHALKEMFIAWPLGHSFSLKCKTAGALPLKVQWYKDGEPLKYSNTKQPWKLRIKKSKIEDGGIYACVVSNKLGSVKRIYNVKILRKFRLPPILVNGYPKNVTARVGDSVSFACLEKDSNVLSNYRWLKSKILLANATMVKTNDKKVVLMSPVKYKAFIEERSGKTLYGVKLVLDHIRKNDEGFYTCSVTNSFGLTYATAHLKVNEMDQTDPPEFLVPKDKRQQHFVETEGDVLTLSSLVRGGAPLQYRWYFNGQTLIPDKRHQINDGELVLENLTVSDKGVYTCVTRNVYGRVKQHFKVRVLERRSMYPVLLASYPKDKTARRGESAKLYCIEKGYSNTIIDYRWLKWHDLRTSFTTEDLRNRSLYTILSPKYYDFYHFEKVTSVSLKFENLTMDDQGLYTCLVSNSHGYAHSSASLFVKEPIEGNVMSNEIFDYPVARQIKSEHPVNTVVCHEYQGQLSKDNFKSAEKCNTTELCGSIYDEKIKYWNIFCDDSHLCEQHGVHETGCKNVTIEGQKMELCCCAGALCNKPRAEPGTTLFAKDTKTTASSKSSRQNSTKLTTFIFLIILLVTFVIMLSLLIHRVRQRKSTAKIVHDTKKNQKLTKRIIMETKWLKEDA